MTCPQCHGKRVIPFVPPYYDEIRRHVSCSYCHGTGTVDCGDGDVSQPEKDNK